jgi:hypothetical protein
MYVLHRQCPPASRDYCHTSDTDQLCGRLACSLQKISLLASGREGLPITAGQDVREQGWLLAIYWSGWRDGRWASACCSLLCSRSLSIILQRARYPGIWAVLEARTRGGRLSPGGLGPTERLERRHQAHQSTASTVPRVPTTSHGDPPTDAERKAVPA